MRRAGPGLGMILALNGLVGHKLFCACAGNIFGWAVNMLGMG
jgi:hypothetical protein